MRIVGQAAISFVSHTRSTFSFFFFVIAFVSLTSSWDRPGRRAKRSLQCSTTARIVDRKRTVPSEIDRVGIYGSIKGEDCITALYGCKISLYTGRPSGQRMKTAPPEPVFGDSVMSGPLLMSGRHLISGRQLWSLMSGRLLISGCHIILTGRILKYRDKSFRTGAVLHQKCPFSHIQKPLFTWRKKTVPSTDVLES